MGDQNSGAQPRNQNWAANRVWFHLTLETNEDGLRNVTLPGGHRNGRPTPDTCMRVFPGRNHWSGEENRPEGLPHDSFGGLSPH